MDASINDTTAGLRRGCSKATLSPDTGLNSRLHTYSSTSTASGMGFTPHWSPCFPATHPLEVVWDHARNYVSGLLWYRCLCELVSLIMVGNCSNEDHKDIQILPAEDKCFIAWLKPFSKLLPTTLLGRQRDAGEKKFNFHTRWFFLMSTIVHTLSKGQDHTVVTAVVICFGECWKFPHGSLAILYPKTWKHSKKERPLKINYYKPKSLLSCLSSFIILTVAFSLMYY